MGRCRHNRVNMIRSDMDRAHLIFPMTADFSHCLLHNRTMSFVEANGVVFKLPNLRAL
jgi:hypothetical protein